MDKNVQIEIGPENAKPDDTKVPVQANEKAKTSPKSTKPFPGYTLEDALRIPRAIAEYNAGNPWTTEQIAAAVEMSHKSSLFYYFTTASRDYGMTTGTGRAKIMELTALGRKIVYPEGEEEESNAIQKAFFNIDIFKKVYEYYKGGNLPEKRFLFNTLQESFDLEPKYHEEFLQIFTSNIKYLHGKTNINHGNISNEISEGQNPLPHYQEENGSTPTNRLFVIMPFSEKTGKYPEGYFDEVFSSLIVPAAAQAGYIAETANRQGSDIIHKTIVSSIYNAEMILADLTEHNPNVLFELGLAIAFKKKVAIIRARGTNPIFDVDNSMRVLDYSPNLWKSTLEMDVTKLAQHIEATSISDDGKYLDIFMN